MYFIKNLKNSLSFISYVWPKESMWWAVGETIEQKALSWLTKDEIKDVEKFINSSDFSVTQKKEFYSTLSLWNPKTKKEKILEILSSWEWIVIKDIEWYLKTLKNSLKSDEQIQWDISGNDWIDVSKLKPKQKEFYDGIKKLRWNLEAPQAKIKFIWEMKNYIDNKLTEELKKEIRQDLSEWEQWAKEFVIFIDWLTSRLSSAIGEETKISKEIIELLDALKDDIRKATDELEYDLWIEIKWDKITKDVRDKEKFKTMDNKEFLKISSEQRLQYITKNHVDSSSISSWDVNSLEFTFTFDWEYNKELYLKTTAGQVLPQEVWVVESWGQTYERKWLDWEFFTSWNKRLIIKEWTNVNIEKVRTTEEIDKMIEDNAGKLNDYKLNVKNKVEGYKEWFDDIVSEAIERWIDVKFAISAFSEKVWETKDIFARTVLIEEMFTQYDRKKWKIDSTYKDANEWVQISILKEYTSDWKKSAKESWISDEVINTVTTASSDLNIDFDAISGKAKDVVSYALQLEKLWREWIMWAKHCTDWVNIVFKKTTWKRVYDSNTLFNWVKTMSWWTGLWVKEYASISAISKIKAWDHIIVDKPKSWTFWVGSTHSIIPLWTPVDWIVDVVSYPNWNNPIKIEKYDLYWKWRINWKNSAKGNWKPIRIQRA